MKNVFLKSLPGFQKPSIATGALFFAAAIVCLPMAAQQEGPLKLPPPPPPAAASKPPETRATAAQSASRGISNEPPSVPVEQIIQRFSQHESEFKKERDNFTYTQTFIIQTIDADGRPDGQYRLTSDIVFTPSGKRYEKITDAPAPTLQRITLSQQDLDDLEHVQPFVLTSEELPKYDVKYAGREELDEVGTYVFDVGPKKIEKNQRYFQGRIWVDDREFAVVKSYGKAVPDIRTKNGENVFPTFETFRENIEGNYWFPTFTRSNDTLHFIGQDVRIRMIVRYSNYQRFNVTIKIGSPTEVKPNHP